MPKLDVDSIPTIARTSYPSPHDKPVAGRAWKQLAEAGGLSQFGANLVTLAPGAWSSQRHWHSVEDEMVVMLSGRLVLVEEAMETEMGPGDVAVFPAGVPNGHHLQNRGDAPATFLAIGPDCPDTDVCTYPDIGMRLDKTGISFPG
jgi:uncharacterized cupin superfamily protein